MEGKIALAFEPDSAQLAVQRERKLLHWFMWELGKISCSDQLLPALSHRHLFQWFGDVEARA